MPILRAKTGTTILFKNWTPWYLMMFIHSFCLFYNLLIYCIYFLIWVLIFFLLISRNSWNILTTNSWIFYKDSSIAWKVWVLISPFPILTPVIFFLASLNFLAVWFWKGKYHWTYSFVTNCNRYVFNILSLVIMIALEFANPPRDRFSVHTNTVAAPFDGLSILQGWRPKNML